MEITERFAELMARPEPTIPLDEAALLIAAHGCADRSLDLDIERARLDALAASCPAPTRDALVAHLFADLGFAGDQRDYYDPRNSYLDEVLTRRRGIPITLSVLAMTVGQRLAVPLAGVGMPGHFLVRDEAEPDVFVDPYHGGAVLDRADCATLFHRVHGPGASFSDAFLEPVGTLEIVARMLANLRNAFVSRGDRVALTWVLGLRTYLPGSPAEDQVDLATALASVGRFGDAASAYERAAQRLGGTLGQEYGRNASRLRARLN